MMPASRIGLFNRVLGGVRQLGLDAVLEPVGDSFAFSPERFATPDNLNHVLRHYGVDATSRLMHLTNVKHLDIQSLSSNCNNTVLALDYAGELENNPDLPATVFLKLPTAERMTRLFCHVIRVWELECRVYQGLATQMPVRVPKAYAVGHMGSRFFLLLEDLHADPNVRLFTNADMLAGPSLELTKKCLTTLAKIHAHFAHLEPGQREALLPAELHPYTSKPMRTFARLTANTALARCRKTQPDLFDKALCDSYQQSIASWDKVVDWWYSGPLTFAHGDSHLGNFFVDGDQIGMLDWQAAQWGKGIRDVQYFLIDSLPVDVLAEHEESLIRFYLQELANAGSDLDFDTAWQQYRAYSFQTLLTIVVSAGLGALTERDNVMNEVLLRSVAAVKRVDYAGWLKATI